MSTGTIPPGTEGVEELASTLVQQAARLTRLVFARLDVGLSRSEASLLAQVELVPQRITSLAELDGLAQPTVTLMVKRLETAGLVRREPSVEDGRVVLVSLTESGAEALELVRASYRERLRGCLADLPADDIEALKPATRVVATLIKRLQKDGSR
jgi:DNA-binding MarR family transcriptional regulator